MRSDMCSKRVCLHTMFVPQAHTQNQFAFVILSKAQSYVCLNTILVFELNIFEWWRDIKVYNKQQQKHQVTIETHFVPMDHMGPYGPHNLPSTNALSMAPVHF